MSNQAPTTETLPDKRDLKAGGGLVAIRPQGLSEYWKFAQYIANSDLAPKDYKDKPENCLIAMQMGAEIGLSPMQAIQNIAVVNGRATLYGDAIPALLRQSSEWDESGYEEFFEGVPLNDDFVAVCRMKRKGGKVQERRFSVKDAKLASLWGKAGPWKNYPKRMLQMRARGFNARDNFADVLSGLSVYEEAVDIPYSVETADAITDAQYETEVSSTTESVRDKLRAKLEEEKSASEEAREVHPDDMTAEEKVAAGGPPKKGAEANTLDDEPEDTDPEEAPGGELAFPDGATA